MLVCNYFIWFDEVEVHGEHDKDATLEDFDMKIEEIEILLNVKKVEMKEANMKLHEKDIKIASQRKKIKRMKEKMLTTKRMLKKFYVGCFINFGLIVMFIVVIWSIMAI